MVWKCFYTYLTSIYYSLLIILHFTNTLVSSSLGNHHSSLISIKSACLFMPNIFTYHNAFNFHPQCHEWLDFTLHMAWLYWELYGECALHSFVHHQVLGKIYPLLWQIWLPNASVNTSTDVPSTCWFHFFQL